MVQTATRVDPVLLSPRDHLISRLAEELKESKPQKTPFPLPARLKELGVFFQQAYNYFNQPTQAQVAVSSTSEWLLDNFHVIEQAIHVVQDDRRTIIRAFRKLQMDCPGSILLPWRSMRMAPDWMWSRFKALFTYFKKQPHCKSVSYGHYPSCCVSPSWKHWQRGSRK